MAVGYPARVVALRREGASYGVGKGHVVTEAWNDELAKWIVLDAQNNATWEREGKPLSAVEIRDLLATSGDPGLQLVSRPSRWMKDYAIELNGKRSRSKVSELQWAMKPGANRLSISAINVRDEAGPTTRLEVTHFPR